jgi:penicillin amidase
MAGAYDELVDRFDDDPATWRWGAMHGLELTHGTFGVSGIGPLEALFNRGPLETAGGSDVVNATGWTASAGYEVDWVPSMRMVVDLADLDAGGWVHLTGQSGRPFHPHYTDQAEAWRDGHLLDKPFTGPAVDAAAERRLRLVPE